MHNTTPIKAHLCIDTGDFLDRASLPSAFVFRGNDAAVGTLSELLDELVLAVDDERLIQCLERVVLLLTCSSHLRGVVARFVERWRGRATRSRLILGLEDPNPAGTGRWPSSELTQLPNCFRLPRLHKLQQQFRGSIYYWRCPQSLQRQTPKAIPSTRHFLHICLTRSTGTAAPTHTACYPKLKPYT